MDEAQGRLGTPGALVRRGDKPEASVPAALPVPVIMRGTLVAPRASDAALANAPGLRKALIASLPKPDECGRLSEGGTMRSRSSDWTPSMYWQAPAASWVPTT
jgi:hypothetical protein